MWEAGCAGSRSVKIAHDRRGARDLSDGSARCEFSFAPLGLVRTLRAATHDLRRGLHSFAASRLE